MNHTDIKKNNWLEKYLLHELTAKEETLLEEHLLSCDHCLKELELTKESLHIVKQALYDDAIKTANSFKHNNVKRFTPVFYRIAAVSLLVLAIGTVIIYVHRKPTGTLNPVVDNAKEQPSRLTINDSAIKSQTIPQKSVLAETYKLNSMYENEIQNTYRSSNLTVVSPTQNTVVKQGSVLKFDWNYPAKDSLNLVIINNGGKEMMSQKVKASFLLRKPLQPGLYYWQLQTESELLHTGKFKIEDTQ